MSMTQHEARTGDKTMHGEKTREAGVLAVLDAVSTAKGLVSGVVGPLGDAHPVTAALIPDVTDAREAVASLIEVAQSVCEMEDEPRFLYGCIADLRVALARCTGEPA